MAITGQRALGFVVNTQPVNNASEPQTAVYLDNNATTRPLPEVCAAVQEACATLWANPSSVHRLGQQARQRIELARARVVQLIGCRDRDLIFTSGGTESNHLALHGLIDPALACGCATLITTPVEHAAVREPGEHFEQQGVEVVRLGVNDQGLIDPEQLHEHIMSAATDDQRPGGVIVVSVIWAGNETGVIQPMDRIVEAVQSARQKIAADDRVKPKAKVYLHTDATQAVGKLPVDVSELGVDLLGFAGHKFHGIKGAGGLYVRRGVRLRPVVRGGPQERERRGGTENVPGVLAMGVAAEHALAFVHDAEAVARQRALRDRLEQNITQRVPESRVNAAEAPRLWNTSNIAFHRLEAEAILLGLSEQGVCASAGAACSSGSLEPSPVLLAMGMDEAWAHGSVRLSLSRFTTEAEIDRAVDAVAKVVERLGRAVPV